VLPLIPSLLRNDSTCELDILGDAMDGNFVCIVLRASTSNIRKSSLDGSINQGGSSTFEIFE